MGTPTPTLTGNHTEDRRKMTSVIEEEGPREAHKSMLTGGKWALLGWGEYSMGFRTGLSTLGQVVWVLCKETSHQPPLGFTASTPQRLPGKDVDFPVLKDYLVSRGSFLMQTGAELRLQSRRRASRSAGKVWAATLPPDQESHPR